MVTVFWWELKLLHILLVRRILEYANATAGYAGIHTNNISIEMVQCRAARWVKQDYRRLTSSVSDMIEDLQWLTLCKHGKDSRLTTFISFCIARDPPDMIIPEHYLPHSLSYFTHLSCHQQFIPPTTSTNYYLRTLAITEWNNVAYLINELIESTTLEDFSYYLKSL